MAEDNIQRIAIVGASGRIGKYFVEELLKTGKHNVTAITRHDSEATFPQGVEVARVDYEDHESLVSALRGQQFFIITLSISAPLDTQDKLLKAGAEAKVPYIMPNLYGSADIRNEAMLNDLPNGKLVLPRLEEIRSLGASFIVMTCGYWYEWSLAMGEQWFGFDLKNKTATLYDDGKTRINVSTWRQCGRALAALLSLPESGASPALSDWKNETLYIDSFKVSQRDMLDSIHRVTGSTDKDWEIRYEGTGARFKAGLEEMKGGLRTGFAKAIYARVFFPNGDGDFEASRGLANEKLGLPKEDLDEITRQVLDMVNSGWHPLKG